MFVTPAYSMVRKMHLFLQKGTVKTDASHTQRKARSLFTTALCAIPQLVVSAISTKPENSENQHGKTHCSHCGRKSLAASHHAMHSTSLVPAINELSKLCHVTEMHLTEYNASNGAKSCGHVVDWRTASVQNEMRWHRINSSRVSLLHFSEDDRVVINSSGRVRYYDLMMDTKLFARQLADGLHWHAAITAWNMVTSDIHWSILLVKFRLEMYWISEEMMFLRWEIVPKRIGNLKKNISVRAVYKMWGIRRFGSQF
jgi:hypothetical protein